MAWRGYLSWSWSVFEIYNGVTGAGHLDFPHYRQTFQAMVFKTSSVWRRNIALLIFSPAIYWNIEHGWAFFLFQTHDRFISSSEFSSHEFFASIIVLLSPVGFVAAHIL